MLRWDPSGAKNDEAFWQGMFVGYPLHFKGFFGLFWGVECLVFIGRDDYCLQCFNREVEPTRVSVTCKTGYGQYLVFETSPSAERSQRIRDNPLLDVSIPADEIKVRHQTCISQCLAKDIFLNDIND